MDKKTTIAGAVAGILQVLAATGYIEPQLLQAASGIAVIVMGYLAKDKAVPAATKE